MSEDSSGSLGSGLMSTGRETSAPLLEVSLRGGAGGFSSSSEYILVDNREGEIQKRRTASKSFNYLQ